MSVSVRRLAVSCLIPLWLSAGVAGAHQFAPALLQLVEVSPERVEVLWKEPAVRVVGSRLRPVLPGECAGIGRPHVEREGTGVVARWALDCPGGLVGKTLSVEGIPSSRADVLLRVALRDGRVDQQVLNGDASRHVVPPAPGWTAVAATYFGLGVGHILLGVDHLLFVLGLLLLVRGLRSMVQTLTAFTVAHSLTLALATLGVVAVPPRPVEVAIALSILFLALEVLRVREGRSSITRRNPWAVAFGFGLLHGLGFAGALTEIGLPAGEIPLALLFFNIGIEAGQLLFVVLFVLVRWSLRQLQLGWPGPAHLVPPYLIGGIAAYWVLERISAMGMPVWAGT